MSTTYDFSQLGGLPLTQQVLADMQGAYSDGFAALAALAGDKTIVAGMQVIAGQVTPGWFTYSGALVKFVGGASLPRVIISEAVTALLFEDGQQKPVKKVTTATTGNTGGFAWADLKRIGSLQEMYSRLTPTGLISMWSGTTPPEGWALCDGGGTPARPDLRGRFIVGYHPGDADYNLGNTGGSKTHQLTPSELPAHQHGVSLWRNDSAGGNQGNTAYLGNDNGAVTTGLQTGSTGGGVPHENRPPYYTLAYIIKL